MKRLIAATLSLALLCSFLFVEGTFMFNVFGAGNANYYGLFSDAQSDGGFEYEAWIDEPNQTSATSASSKDIVTDEKHRGNKSAKFTFGRRNESFAMYMTFSNLNNIDLLSDYCWTGWIKHDSNFRGTVELKMVESGNPTAKTGLLTNKSNTLAELWKYSSSTKATDWTRFDSSAEPYRSTAISTFLTGKNSVSVVLIVTCTSTRGGTVWLDDIDFKQIEMLEEDEEIEIGDNTGSLGASYVGLFDDTTSDGGFENKSWILADLGTAAEPSMQRYDLFVKNTDRRSAQFIFDNNKEEKFVLYTKFSDLSEIDLTQNYCWTSYIKTTADFDGKVSLKLGAPAKFNESGILNINSEDNCVIFDAVTSPEAHTKWRMFTTADAYYSAGSLAGLINENPDVTSSGSIGLFITVTATKGKVWIDDLDLQKRSYAVGDDDSVASGEYNGLFDDENSNGGFEHGLWNIYSEKTTALGLSKAVIDTGFVKSGNRAATFKFNNNMSESFVLKMNFKDISEIDTASDYFFKAYIKSGAGFDGNISLKITEPGNSDSALRDKDGNSASIIYEAASNGGSAAYSAVTSVTARYSADAIDEFLKKSSVISGGFDVILTVSSTTGQVWIDDIDFLSYDNAIKDMNLEDPDTAYSVDDSDYIGFFDEESSNGGFEYGPWTFIKDKSTAQIPTVYYTDTESKKSGKRSFKTEFSGETNETLTFKMTSYRPSDILDEDYVISSFMKTSDDFKGKVSVVITESGDYSAALKNAEGKAETVLLENAVYSKFSRVDSSSNPFKKADIEAFKAAASADGSFDVYLVINADKGKIWIDDIDFLTADALQAEKDKPVEGAKYDGIFKNGGFENGPWDAENLANHGVEYDEDNTYNESLKSVKVYSAKATGHSGALILNGKTIPGKAAELDSAVNHLITMAVKTSGEFTGSIYMEIKNGNNQVLFNNNSKLYLIENSTVNFSDWKIVSTPEIAVTGEDITVKLYVDGEGTLYFDDVNIIEDPDNGNIINNGGFENGSWKGAEGMKIGASVSTEYSVTHNSPKAMKFKGVEGRSYVYVGTTTQIDSSKDYKMTLSTKTVDVDYGAAYIMILCGGNAGQSKWVAYRGQERLCSTGGNTDWINQKVIISDLPDWTTRFNVYVNLESEGVFYVDNIYITDELTADDYKTTQAQVEGAKYDGVLYNGGFEAGLWNVNIYDNQKISIDTENTYNNSKGSLKVETFQQYANREKAFKISTFTISDFAKDWDLTQSYRISLYLKTSTDFDGSVYVRVKQGDAYKWYNYSTELLLLGTVANGSAGYSEWTYLYTPTFAITDQEAAVELWVDGIGTAWIDDVDLVIDPEADNYLSNGGFESGLWSTFGTDSREGKKAELVTDVTNGTAKAAKLSSTSAEEMFLVGSNKIEIDPSKTYKFSIDIKTEGVAQDSVYVRIMEHYVAENGAAQTRWLTVYGSEQVLRTGGDTDWTTYSVNCNRWQSSLTHIWVYIVLNGEGTVYFDNIVMKEKTVDTNVPAGSVGSDTDEGDVDAGTVVRLFTSDENGDIYYTTDGSNPKTNKAPYLYDDIYGISITEDTTIKAYVVSEEAADGEVAEFKYTCSGYVKEDKLLDKIKMAGTATLDTANKKIGKNAIKLKGNGASVNVATGRIKLDTSFDYKIEFWVKTEDMLIDGSSYANIFIEGAAGIENKDGVKGSYYIDPYKLCEIKNNQDWTHYEFIIDDMRGSYKSLDLSFGINNDMGTMWIDGIKVTALPYEKYALTVWGDGAQLGNIYTQNILSSFTINQGFIVKNDAKSLESGMLAYAITEDTKPDEILATGEIEIGVRGGASSTYSEILAAIAKYGTYTVSFTMKNSRGKEYPAGSIAVSRIMDNSDINDETLHGVCVNFVNETQRSLEYIESFYKVFADSGMGMLRTDLNWEQVVDKDGNYSIPERYDQCIELNNKYGIEQMIIFNSHQTDENGGSIFPDTDKEIAEFIKFVKFVVKHFKGKVYYYELFNETNFMHYTKIDGAGYVRLLKEVYKAVKEIDPKAKLIGGVTSNFAHSYAEDIFKAGGSEYMDYYSCHPYVYPKSPEDAEWKENLQALKDTQMKYSDKDLPFMLTEFGWSAVETQYGATEQEKLEYFVRAYNYAKSLGFIEKITVYNAYCGNNFYGLESNWGLYGNASADKYDTVAGSARPVTAGLAAFNKLTHGYEFVKEEKFAEELYSYKYTDNKGKDMYILWTNNLDYDAEITATDTIKVSDIFGNTLSVESNEDTYYTDVGGMVKYVVLNSGESIEKIVLKEKGNSSKDENSREEETESEENNEDYEIIEDEPDEDEDDEKEKTVKKMRKKVTKVVRKGGAGSGLSLMWIIIIAVVALAVVAGSVILIILLKRKRKNKKLPQA